MPRRSAGRDGAGQEYDRGVTCDLCSRIFIYVWSPKSDHQVKPNGSLSLAEYAFWLCGFDPR
jgi:hypothetical protein